MQIVAADLLAQAEHDVAARSILVATDAALIDKAPLPMLSLPPLISAGHGRAGAAAVDTSHRGDGEACPLWCEVGVKARRVAMERNSFAVLVSSLAEGADISNRLAPEHLEVTAVRCYACRQPARQVHTRAPETLLPSLHHFGAVFVGNLAAEVLGDYGAGPNHTLPTGGTARSFGGLSVHTFTRVRTWLQIDDAKAGLRCDSCADLMAGRRGAA